LRKEIDDLNDTLNDMLDNIQRSLESQKRFTSDVSHEIRSPLTSLRGSIEVALRKKRTLEEYEDVLRSNLADVVRLSRTIDNLLFLSRADHKSWSQRQWFDVKHLIEGVVEGFRYKAVTEGLSIVEDYQKNLELNGDIDLLEQAFSNIIDNAIKYTPRGGKITLRTQEEDSVIKVVISDTGIGIPEEELPHIFDRFYRVDKQHTKKFGGTGLGLAITHWIIKAHNGELLVTSSVGKGSEFTIILPKTPD
jgi:signal transduction histidine kinase